MKRAIILIATIAVSLFLIFTYYSYSSVPYVPGISHPTSELYSPAYINETVAGVKSSVIIYSDTQTVKNFRIGVVDTGLTYTYLFYINVISESKNMDPFSLGLRVVAISGYIENSSSPFQLPIINFHLSQYHQNSVIVAVYNFTYPIPPNSFHDGEYVPGNYTGTFNVAISLTPTLWVYHEQSSSYVTTVTFPIIMF
ncbi:MAG: hypothetical protein M1290_04850 [Candidatus Thermoplasmatota archaeon]|jgi:hypothetical protein|nr:hypothetical protein [Candidatus Thermoplasmatota archaeon]MCL5789774.1 hypothetical protein [Candidatus Thermoplasmatota archaeon]